WLRQRRRQLERLGNPLGWRVRAERPRDLVGRSLARQHVWRCDEVVSLRGVTRSRFPWKFTEHEERRRGGRFGMLEPWVVVRDSAGECLARHALEHRHVVPMAVILGEIPKAVFRIPQQILAPRIGDAGDADTPHLKADRLPALRAERSGGPERNERRNAL